MLSVSVQRRSRFGGRAVSWLLAAALSLDPVGSLLAAVPWPRSTTQDPHNALSVSANHPPPVLASATPSAGTPARQRFGNLPLYFVENQGQVDPRVAYYARGSANSVYLTREGMVLSLSNRAASQGDTVAEGRAADAPDGDLGATARWTVRLDFEDANPDVRIRGRERAEAVVSYLKGRPSEWKTDLPTYADVVYEDLWEGIDLVYSSEGGQPKYTFVVEPGADPSRIRLAYRGASAVRLTEEGRLSVETPVTTFEEDVPYSYQEDGGTRTEVASGFALESSPTAGEGRFGFRVGPYDPTKPLVLDPAVLVYCGYIGGTGGGNGDEAFGVAVDAAGAAYVTGATTSTDFPATVGAYDTTHNNNRDVLVAKVRADGTGLVYATYIGGAYNDIGRAVAVDSSGNAYVTGDTTSDSFPTVAGPDLVFNDTPNSETNAFVLKLNAAGSALVYSGFIEGANNDNGRGIVVDTTGFAFVVGDTFSDTLTAPTFPITAGAYDNSWGNSEAFVAKVATNGASLVYCTYIGGYGTEYAKGIAIDTSGNAYVTGETNDYPNSPPFPVTAGAYDQVFNGPGTGAGTDAFVTKLNSTGTALVYSTFLGGTASDSASGISLDASGNAYVVGQTASSDFPRTSLQTWSGGWDGFVTKLNSTGTALVYSGFIGGSTYDSATSIAVDGSGSAYVAGSTDSTEASFPETGGPDLTYNGGSSDAFVARVNPAGTALFFCTYLGGSGDEYAYAVAVDGLGAAYVAGTTTSTEATFPETVGPDLTHNGPGSNDAFVAKIQSSVMQVKTGQYVGNGSTQSITGLGFSPDYVMVTSAETWGRAAVVTTRSMSSNVSNALDAFAYAPLTNRITSLDADGFSVGHPATHAPNNDVTRSTSAPYHCVNHSGVVYYWTAFQAADGEMKVDKYVGDGAGTKDVAGVGFQPDYLIVFPASGAYPTHRSSTMTGNINFVFDGAAGRANQIVALQADGFQVGSTGFSNFNTSGATYHYVAWKRTTGRINVGSYTGNNAANRLITGVGFRPEFLTITPSNTTNPTGNLPAWSAIMKAGVTGAYSDYAQEYIAYTARSLKDWIHALEPDGFRVARTASFLDPVNKSTDTYHWAAFGPFNGTAFPNTNLRSIGSTDGTNPTTYTQGTAAVASGSVLVTGGGAPAPDWVAANRGRGDKITFDGGTTWYTVSSVNSATSLTLTSPFAGTGCDAGCAYTISRKFATLPAWENCIDGPTSSATCEGVASSSLVSDGRQEVGIAYEDSVFTETAANCAVTGATCGVEITGSTTSSANRILLTADGPNRHTGIAGTGARLDGTGATGSGIVVIDSNVTVEWLEVKNFTASAQQGLLVRDGATNVLLQNLLVYDNNNGVGGGGSALESWTLRNSIVYSNNNDGVAGDDLNDAITVENCTIFGNTGNGIDGNNTTTTLVVRNVVAMNGSTTQLAAGPSYSYTVTSDGSPSSGCTANCATGVLATTNTVTCSDVDGCVTFQNITSGTENLHLVSTTYSIASNKAVDKGSTLAGFSRDVDGQFRPGGAAWDIGADELNGTTAVRLASLTARGFDESVLVEWATGMELDNLGFHLYRGVSMDGPWERLTGHMIQGLGSSPEGRRYSFLDAPLRNGTTYYYRLEDIDRSGKVAAHGPVSATPLDGAGAPGEETPGETPGVGETAPAGWTEHGDPRDVSLRLLSRTSRSVTFELRTGGFYSLPQEDGSHRLFVPGFFDLAEPGYPTLPTRRTWTDAVPGLGARVQSVSAEEIVSFDGLVPPRAGAPAAVTMHDGTYQKALRPVAARPLSRGLFPREQARVLQTAFQGDTKKAYVEILPLRLDSARGRLVLARRMIVTVLFDGVVPGETGLGGSSGRSLTLRRQPPADGRLIARFATRSRGLHAVAWEDLLAATSSPGGDLASSALMLDTASMRLSRLGVPVPFHVEPRPDRFVPGSTLFFLAEDVSSAYTGEAVFELAVATGGLRMALGASSRGRSGSTEPLASLIASLPLERNLDYLPGLLDSPDPWLWSGFLSGSSASYPFSLQGLAPGDASISVRLMGGSDTTDPQDHRVALSLNGTPLGEAAWDGMAPFTFSAPVPDSVLTEGANTLLLEGRGSPSSAVYLDRFSLEHPRSLSPLAGSLEATASRDGVARVSGFDPGAVLLEISPRTTRWLGRSRSSEIAFSAQKDHRYLAVSPSAVLRPLIRPVSLSSLRDPANRADWIAVAPREFLPALEPLTLHRQAQGLATAAVAIEDVFAEFGFGETSPDALRDFLAFAYHHWASPAPRYVLLLGDATYDPRGFFSGTSRRDLVPSPFVRSSFLWTPSDPLLASVNGDDLLPDLALGRIPASTLAEATDAVQKILDFESAGRTLHGDAVLVADNPDPAGDFEQNANDIASLLTSRTVRKIFLSQYGSSTKAQVLAAFDSGPALVSYVGHGSASLWANSSENVLRSTDVPLLQPQPQQPLLLTMTCSNGYFVSPFSNSISERLALAPDKGSIAAFSPSGLSLDSAAHLYHRAVVTELEAGQHHRLGDLLLAAQANYTQSGAFPELLSLYHLFADPALKVR